MIAQVETLLNNKEPIETANVPPVTNALPHTSYLDFAAPTIPDTAANGTSQYLPDTGVNSTQMDGIMNDAPFTADEPFTWEVISLGLEEPLPSQEVIDEL